MFAIFVNDDLRVTIVNTDAKAVSNVPLYISAPENKLPKGQLRNFVLYPQGSPHTAEFLGFIFSFLKSCIMFSSSEREFYDSAKSSPVEGGDLAVNGPAFTIDDQLSSNFISATSGYPNAWLEISLTQPTYVSGLEFSVMSTDNEKFRKINVLGGSTSTPWSQDEGGDSVDTHHTKIGRYIGPAANGETVYFPFMDVKFVQHIMLQFENIGSNPYFELSELRVIIGKISINFALYLMKLLFSKI